MAITIIPEDGTGLETANSYLSLAEANTYFEAHLYGTAWAGADDPTKDKALAQSTRLLDASTNWEGDKKTRAQLLQWPRLNVELDGFDLESDIVPVEIKNATAELAGLFISNDLTAEVDQNALAGISLGKGALELNFDAGNKKRKIPIHIDDLLRGLGSVSTGGSGIKVVRITR